MGDRFHHPTFLLSGFDDCGDRNFSQPVTLVEGVGFGEAIGKVEGNLHDDSLALWIYFKVWVSGSGYQSDRHEWYRLD